MNNQIIHGDLDSLTEEPQETAEDVFAETLVPQLPEVPFIDNLAVFVKVLRRNPELVETVDHIRPALPNQLYIRVFTGMGATVLELWALLLTDISTSAYRYEKGVDGEICGLLDTVRVKIVGIIPSDAVPEGGGAHEWTLSEVPS